MKAKHIKQVILFSVIKKTAGGKEPFNSFARLLISMFYLSLDFFLKIWTKIKALKLRLHFRYSLFLKIKQLIGKYFW